MNSPFELQIDFKNDCNWIFVADIFDYIEDMLFTIKRKQVICKRMVYFQLYNNLCNRDENYKWCYQKHTLSLFSQALVQATCLTGRKRFVLGHEGWEFSGHAWFMRFLLAWPTGKERPIQAFVTTILKFSNVNSLPSFV